MFSSSRLQLSIIMYCEKKKKKKCSYLKKEAHYAP